MTTSQRQFRAAVRFFFKKAGSSYNPATETERQGKIRGAKSLANAERKASARGYSFQWKWDGSTSGEFSDEHDYPLWGCLMIDPTGNPVGALSGIDFGNGGEPWGDDYRRVVEAELAAEEFAE